MAESSSKEFKPDTKVKLIAPCKCIYWDEKQTGPSCREMIYHKIGVVLAKSQAKSSDYLVKFPGMNGCNFKKEQLIKIDLSPTEESLRIVIEAIVKELT